MNSQYEDDPIIRITSPEHANLCEELPLSRIKAIFADSGIRGRNQVRSTTTLDDNITIVYLLV